MGMDDAIAVARLVAALGEVKGRKRLQKIVHLVRAKGSPDFNYRFMLHFFGPFSRELASDLDFLVGAELVKEEQPLATDGAYTYSCPSKDVDQRLREAFDDEETDEPEWLEFAKRLNEKETPMLEALSTLVHLGKRISSDKELKGKFKRVKPQLVGHFAKAMALRREFGLSSTPPA